MVQASGGGSSYLIATILILMLMHMHISVAVQHVVGDDRGWDPLSDLPGWTSRNVFCVGDNLWFAYSTARGSILELKSAEEYERCDVSNPIRVYDGGLDAVPLAEAGTRYFISARPEHCQRGLKLRVQVISDGLHNHNSDNFDVVSDGLDNVGSSFDRISDGMEKGGDDDTDLVSDGLKETANNFNILILLLLGCRLPVLLLLPGFLIFLFHRLCGQSKLKVNLQLLLLLRRQWRRQKGRHQQTLNIRPTR